jgi:hypothetical protein
MTIESYWNTADRDALWALCEATRVSTLLVNLPWRQISPGFRERIEKAWANTTKNRIYA